MGLDDLFQRIADSNRAHGFLENVAQGAASVAAPVYTVGALLNRLLHEGQLLPQLRLNAPVVSVGNITMGGTGKTPFCLWLIDFLRSEGLSPAVLTRGYGREDESRLVVVHDGRRLLAGTREAGDEPVLLARTLGDVPIVACSSRARSGRLVLKRFASNVLVLDDGFQHHRLARNLDIVLVDTLKRPGRLKLFPRGSLREPLSTLQKADLIVMTRWQQARNPRRSLEDVKQAAPGVPIVRSRIAITGAVRLGDRQNLPLEELRGKTALLVCGVGNPASVRESAREIGLRVVGMKVLPDHAAIRKDNLLLMDSVRRRRGIDYIVITEKDAVKVIEQGTIPAEVIALRARVEMVDAEDDALARRIIRGRLRATAVRGLLSVT